MYSLNASKKNTQSIRINMLPSYLHLAEEATLYMSQYDKGLYNYRIYLYEKNSPYNIESLEDKTKDATDNLTPTDTTDEIGDNSGNDNGGTSDNSTDNTEGVNTSDTTTDENSGNTTDEIIVGDGEDNTDIDDNTSDNTDSSTDGNTDNIEDNTTDDSEATDSDTPEPVASTVKVYIQGVKPDNKVFRYEADYAGNVVFLPLRDQITNVPGVVRCEIIIIKDDMRKTSEIFYINVEKSLIQDAYKVSKNEVVKLANEDEAEYVEPEDNTNTGEITPGGDETGETTNETGDTNGETTDTTNSESAETGDNTSGDTTNTTIEP